MQNGGSLGCSTFLFHLNVKLLTVMSIQIIDPKRGEVFLLIEYLQTGCGVLVPSFLMRSSGMLRLEKDPDRP